jgi:glycosyltransferase involved in cell wall biosynthesis
MYDTGRMHHKIAAAIPRMCAAMGSSLEITRDMSRLRHNDYDLLVSPCHYIDPTILPPTVFTIIGPQIWPEGPIVGPLRTSGNYVYNNLSPWVGDFIVETAKSLICPMACLPTSVDTMRFAPSNEDRTLVLFYTKHRIPTDIEHMRSLLYKKGIHHTSYNYGSYSEPDYLRDLKRAKFMVVVDGHESQGYALQEAMSCGVPLVVWDVESMHQEYSGNRQIYPYDGRALIATSVPYWDDRCGVRTTKKEELEAALDTMLEKWCTYSPRDLIIEQLSDKACVQRWLDLLSAKPEN